MPGPLDGVKVVEVAIWWFVPAAGAILADWGADVIKVEHPETGDPQRALFTSGLIPNTGGVNFMMEQSNRGKRSIGIDLATEGGREVLYDLVKDADVFLTNFLAPARRRLEIDVEDIKAVNPAIVYARGTGQGPEGPDADKGGYDAAAFWSRGGIAHAVTPADAEQPVMQKAAFGDSIGAMTIAGGIAAGLLQKERTGAGPVVDISLLGTAMWALGPDIVSSKLLEEEGMGGGFPSFSRKANFNPLVNTYPTKDGRWLILNMLQGDLFWPEVCRHLGREDLIEDPRFADGAARFEHREACIAILDEEFMKHTLEEWKQKLDTMEGVWAPMQSALELHDDPQAVANGYLPQLTTPEGKDFRLVASPVQFDQVSPTLRTHPEHGQHTEEILLAMGMDWERLAALKESGAVL
jgi:crotonobetainyl-CoA:carnitine CoA-transferase CaiB-like acyl-CoA transferase